MDTWASGMNEVDIDEVSYLLESWLPESDGITITGGEPFDQPSQLRHILEYCRSYPHISTFIYSGYPIESLGKHLQSMVGLIDLIMADPLNISYSQRKPIRGSDNQRLVSLSERGNLLARQIDDSCVEENHLDFTFDGDTAWFAGIPRRGDISAVAEKLQQKGFDAIAVEDKRAIPE